MAHKYHWHILGAGSMGLLWAYYLRQSGHRVSIICRSEDEYELLQKNLPLQITVGATNYCIDVELSLANAPQAIENLLICTKAQHSQQAVIPLLSRLQAKAYVILLQNGCGNEPELLPLLSAQLCFKASTSEAAKKIAPMHIEHRGYGETWLGALQTENAAVPIERLDCALTLQATSSITQVSWQKLIVNCVINPLTCIYNCLNGELLQQPSFDSRLQMIVDECLQVAHKMAIPLVREDCIERIYKIIDDTAANSSSMREDILQQRETEIAYINGYIVAQAAAFSLNTPYNLQLVQAVDKLQGDAAANKKTKDALCPQSK